MLEHLSHLGFHATVDSLTRQEEQQKDQNVTIESFQEINMVLLSKVL